MNHVMYSNGLFCISLVRHYMQERAHAALWASPLWHAFQKSFRREHWHVSSLLYVMFRVNLLLSASTLLDSVLKRVLFSRQSKAAVYTTPVQSSATVMQDFLPWTASEGSHGMRNVLTEQVWDLLRWQRKISNNKSTISIAIFAYSPPPSLSLWPCNVCFFVFLLSCVAGYALWGWSAWSV